MGCFWVKCNFFWIVIDLKLVTYTKEPEKIPKNCYIPKPGYRRTDNIWLFQRFLNFDRFWLWNVKLLNRATIAQVYEQLLVVFRTRVDQLHMSYSASFFQCTDGFLTNDYLMTFLMVWRVAIKHQLESIPRLTANAFIFDLSIYPEDSKVEKVIIRIE
jgi:hypothetical protein